MQPLRVLKIDIETAPNAAYVWSPKVNWISAEHMIETSRVLCASWQWGKEQVEFDSIWDSTPDQFIHKMWMLIDAADVVITYNGDRFDLPILNREFLLHGYTPPSPYFSLDLFRTVKKNFRFTHSSLDSVSQALGIGAKTKHTGFKLWVDVMNGDEKAQKLMERYNKQDVRLLTKLYSHLLPWIQSHPNVALHTPGPDHMCPKCGSKHVHKRGKSRTKTQVYQRYQCDSCGSWSRSRFTELTIEERRALLTPTTT